MNWMMKRLLVNRLTEYVRNQLAKVNESAVIVLGNQKSGTSAIAHLLADYGRLSKRIDIPPLWGSLGYGIDIMRGQIEFASVVKRYKTYFSRELIKEPMMTFFADKVIEVFPKGKYVFVIRDPRDNIRSSLNRRGIPGDLREIEERLIPGPERNRIIIRTITDPSTWGGGNENYVGVLAHKWNMAVDGYLNQQERMTLAKYEDFMSDKCGYIAELAKRLGIPKRNNINGNVDIQYQPRGNHNVSWEEFFGQRNLKRVERICGSRMKKFGYS